MMGSVVSAMRSPIIDEIGRDLPSHFIIRARNEDEMSKKIRTVIERTPKTKDVAIYHIGYRPDVEIPVSRYFVEIGIYDHDPYRFPNYIGWTRVIRGGK